ncbi:TVP38/TMEM64 family protein [Lysinibacillus sp. NPDC097195]|uniref:TVP38/TMEM64 family protein n=1 Tax=Lysinibacillus sp. NPDC097195 TaxID=3364141 RepID=UPI0037F956ED
MRKKLTLIIIWVFIICLVKHFDILSFNVGTLQDIVASHKDYAYLLFIGLWLIRLVVLIPGTTLMILGGVCFSPLAAFCLSSVGLLVSETLVYFVSKGFVGRRVHQYLENKYPDLKDLLLAYHYKFLAIGVICPIAPADVICFLSASVGIKYSTYLLTIMIASTPLRIVYSFIGNGLHDYTIGLVLVMVSLFVLIVATNKIWHNLKEKRKIAFQQSSR